MSFNLDEKKLYEILEKRKHTSHYSLTGDWVNGFIEADGSFLETREGNPFFQCTQHSSDYPLICAIREFLGQGNVTLRHRDDGRIQAIHTLRGKQELKDSLLPFLKEPVLTNKSINQLLPWLDKHFPAFQYQTKEFISGEWLTGFADGDGSFYTVLRRQKDYKSGYQFQAVFDLAQRGGFSGRNGVLNLIKKNWSHLLGAELPIQQVQQISSCGKKGQVDHLRLVRPRLLWEYIIPFYENFPLQSRKEIQFALWKEGVQSLLEKRHLKGNFEEILSYRERCKNWQLKHTSNPLIPYRNK